MDDQKPNELVEKLLNEDPGDEHLDPVYVQRRDATRAAGKARDDEEHEGEDDGEEDGPPGRDDDSDGSWSESDFESELDNAISEVIPGARCRTYADVGMLTSNKGLVVQTPHGEFQVTIVRRR